MTKYPLKHEIQKIINPKKQFYNEKLLKNVQK